MPISPFALAARRFLDEAGEVSLDYSNCIVLVPHLAAARDFQRGLACTLGVRAVLPPRCLTLPAWAATVPDRPAPEPDSRRLADIYGFLRRAGRLQERQLWAAAQELSGLLRELSDGQRELPADFDAFQARLERAYRRKLGGAMSFEARLAHELWHAFQRLARSDTGRDYAERLAWLAEHASSSLYHLDLPGLSPVELTFFERYRERQPVIHLPVEPAYQERHAALAEAWQGEGAQGELAAMDEALGLYGADGAEPAARMAEAQVRLWLAEGRERIGIVAFDRVLARRLRALLERRHILLQDETGWTFSTAAVSHVLDRWFALLQDDCYHRDLLDLLKSPYVFADLAEVERRQAVGGLELALRRHGVVGGWSRIQRLARELELPAATAVLERLQAARGLFGTKRLSMAAWQARLLQALDMLGATPEFEADVAGRQLLVLLRRLQAENEVSVEAHADAVGVKRSGRSHNEAAAENDASYRLAEWRRWLLLQLDQATFVDDRVESPLRLTHLRAARLREFDAVLLLGADAARLPERAGPGLFNEAVRQELGLPTQAEKEAELQAALADVLARAPKVAAVWQARRDGEPVALSPRLETLDLWHRTRFGRGLRQVCASYAELADEQTVFEATAEASPRPARLSERVTVSGWQSLIACPYLYYARHLLGLNELDEVPEEMDKRDYGTLIHAALAKFHADRDTLLGVERPALESELASAVENAFAEAGQDHFLAEAWRLRWQRRQAAYLDWAVDWERQGHRFVKAEAKASLAVAVGEAEISFEGRLDRLDRGSDGLVVLDYKTNAAQTLRNKLKQPGEDVQLPSYAWLTEAAEAGFVALDEDKVAWLAWKDGLADAARAEAARFADTFQAIAAGAAMSAHGAASLCRHCEMRGLCRRDHHT